ncbi:hypothetical protein QTO34_007622 [Cnephaeus nilssonii]|uniref:Uncharacterized protein n=1 Tax=Cnephaeus nilssonii TaxID=3371016 RepID=A0AA40HIN5_CNENI|nr:hypothetical protein QTO34_007622 [Eptesicus nilssonii]
MLEMLGGFTDMVGIMNNMIGNMEHMTAECNYQTFSSSTVISYSNMGDGTPKVYQMSGMHSAPGRTKETPRTMWHLDSRLEQMSTGHHITDPAHILQCSQSHCTGDQEQQDH